MIELKQSASVSEAACELSAYVSGIDAGGIRREQGEKDEDEGCEALQGASGLQGRPAGTVEKQNALSYDGAHHYLGIDFLLLSHVRRADRLQGFQL